MFIFHLQSPGQGATVHVPVQVGENFAFDFDMATAHFSVDGNNLVIDLEGAGTIVLEGFLALSAEQMPEITLLDGTVVDAADYLSSIDPDLIPAAGPEEKSNSELATGGSGEYADNAGEGISGVDSLGQLDSDHWSNATGTPLHSEGATPLQYAQYSATPFVSETQVAAGPGFGGAASPVSGPTGQPIFEPQDSGFGRAVPGTGPTFVPAGGPVEPQGGVGPVAPPAPGPIAPPAPVDGEYVSRAVLYNTGPAAGNTLSFELLYNGKPITGVDAQDVSITSANGWGHAYFNRDGFGFDPDTGMLTVTLTAEGLAAMAGNSRNLYDYITVTVNGAAYNMQLVVNQDGLFDSAKENLLTTGGFSLQDGLSEVLWGEWHNETGGTGAGQRASAGGHDSVIFHSASGAAFNKQTFDAGSGDNSINISGVKGVSGGTITAGDGQDTITISGGNADKTQFGIGGGATLSTGAGDDSISVSGFIGVSGSTIDAGSGNNTVTIAGSDAVGGRGVDGGTIRTGDGNDDISISGDIGLRLATVDSGKGSDTITISGARGMDSSTLNANADALGDRITITGATDRAMQKSTLNAGDGDDIIHISSDMDAKAATLDYGSTVNLGKGHDTLEISGYKAGTNSTINADADDLGDTITLRSQLGWQGNLTEGAGYINMGGGDDTLDIRTEGVVVNGSQGIDHTVVNMGGGKDTITISGTTDAASHLTFNAGANDTGGDVYNLEGRGSRGIYDSTINAGDGDDVINISAATSAVVNSTINAGGGHDTLDITAKGGAGLSYSNINMDADNHGDTVHITASGDGLYQGVIHAGAGDDQITIRAGDAGMTSHSANTGSLIDLGDGHNTLTIEADGVVASTKSQIIGGADDDHINLISHGSMVLHSSSIDTGAGNDTVHIDYAKDVTSTASNAPTSSINLGDGNDLITFGSHESGAGLINSKLFLSGGDNDAFHITHSDLGAGHAVVGDIVGFSGTVVDQLVADTSTAVKFMPNVSGFEALLVDFTDGAKDAVNLDSLLRTMDKLNDTNKISSLIIKGDESDSMPDMSGHDAGHHVENVTIENLDGMFAHHTVHYGDEDIHVFIQMQTMATTG